MTITVKHCQKYQSIKDLLRSKMPEVSLSKTIYKLFSVEVLFLKHYVMSLRKWYIGIKF